MDMSKWIQFNPKITVEPTTKKYFGKYLYRVAIYCPAGRLIDNHGDLTEALASRKEMTKHINYGGYWGLRNSKDIDKANIPLLEVVRGIRKNPAGIKLRVEEPHIQLYANTQEELFELLSGSLNPFVDNLESVSGPANKEAESLLNSGAIIRKKDIGYRYKIIIKDGRYTMEDKNNLLAFLSNFGPDDIRVSATGLEMLSKSTGFVWNLYLYSNDLSITTFLNLIKPGIVLNSHELVILE